MICYLTHLLRPKIVWSLMRKVSFDAVLVLISLQIMVSLWILFNISQKPAATEMSTLYNNTLIGENDRSI